MKGRFPDAQAVDVWVRCGAQQVVRADARKLCAFTSRWLWRGSTQSLYLKRSCARRSHNLSVNGLVWSPQCRSRVRRSVSRSAALGRSPSTACVIPQKEIRTGWYIWCGEYWEAPDFFSPLHVEHISDYLPAVAEYLSLPPGYRFLIDGASYEDVWFDASVLEV